MPDRPILDLVCALNAKDILEVERDGRLVLLTMMTEIDPDQIDPATDVRTHDDVFSVFLDASAARHLRDWLTATLAEMADAPAADADD